MKSIKLDNNISIDSSGITHNRELLSNILNGINGTILWENNGSISEFSRQDISLNTTNYNCYEVIYQLSTFDTRNCSTGKIRKGKGTQMIFLYNQSDASIYISREVTYVNANTLKIENCYASNSTSIGNNRCIPLLVIGYNLSIYD